MYFTILGRAKHNKQISVFCPSETFYYFSGNIWHLRWNQINSRQIKVENSMFIFNIW